MRQKRLFLHPNPAQLFQTYGNPSLLKRVRSQRLLERLRHLEDVSLETVLAHIEETNAGLEHEGLLIDSAEIAPVALSGLGHVVDR